MDKIKQTDLFGNVFEYGGVANITSSNWEEILPFNIYFDKVKPVKIKDYTEKDKEFVKLMKPLVSKDETRPNLRSVYFEKSSITASDSHILIHLHQKTKYKKRLYDIIEKKEVTHVEYPNWKAVFLPENITTYKLNVKKLLMIVQTFERVTKTKDEFHTAFHLRFGEYSKSIKTSLLKTLLETIIKLGWEDVYISTDVEKSNRPIIFTKTKEIFDKYPNMDFILLMPMLEEGSTQIRVGIDVFFLPVYYDVEKNELIREIEDTKTVININENQTVPDNSIITKDEFLALKDKDAHIIGKNKNLYSHLENYYFLVYKNINIADGVYYNLKGLNSLFQKHLNVDEYDFSQLSDIHFSDNLKVDKIALGNNLNYISELQKFSKWNMVVEAELIFTNKKLDIIAENYHIGYFVKDIPTVNTSNINKKVVRVNQKFLSLLLEIIKTTNNNDIIISFSDDNDLVKFKVGKFELIAITRLYQSENTKYHKAVYEKALLEYDYNGKEQTVKRSKFKDIKNPLKFTNGLVLKNNMIEETFVDLIEFGKLLPEKSKINLYLGKFDKNEYCLIVPSEFNSIEDYVFINFSTEDYFKTFIKNNFKLTTSKKELSEENQINYLTSLKGLRRYVNTTMFATGGVSDIDIQKSDKPSAVNTTSKLRDYIKENYNFELFSVTTNGLTTIIDWLGSWQKPTQEQEPRSIVVEDIENNKTLNKHGKETLQSIKTYYDSIKQPDEELFISIGAKEKLEVLPKLKNRKRWADIFKYNITFGKSPLFKDYMFVKGYCRNINTQLKKFGGKWQPAFYQWLIPIEKYESVKNFIKLNQTGCKIAEQVYPDEYFVDFDYKIDDIFIAERKGYYVVLGNTYQYKSKIKSLGFSFDFDKKYWATTSIEKIHKLESFFASINVRLVYLISDYLGINTYLRLLKKLKDLPDIEIIEFSDYEKQNPDEQSEEQEKTEKVDIIKTPQYDFSVENKFVGVKGFEMLKANCYNIDKPELIKKLGGAIKHYWGEDLQAELEFKDKTLHIYITSIMRLLEFDNKNDFVVMGVVEEKDIILKNILTKNAWIVLKKFRTLIESYDCFNELNKSAFDNIYWVKGDKPTNHYPELIPVPNIPIQSKTVGFKDHELPISLQEDKNKYVNDVVLELVEIFENVIDGFSYNEEKGKVLTIIVKNNGLATEIDTGILVSDITKSDKNLTEKGIELSEKIRYALEVYLNKLEINYLVIFAEKFKQGEVEQKLKKGGLSDFKEAEKTTNGKNGGLLVGKLHIEGGMKAVVNSVGTVVTDKKLIEMEDKEAIIKRTAVLDFDNKFEFEGKKMYGCEILSEINERANGNKLPCESLKKQYGSKTKKTIFNNGGISEAFEYTENEKIISDNDIIIDFERLLFELKNNLIDFKIVKINKSAREGIINNAEPTSKKLDFDNINGIIVVDIDRGKYLIVDGNKRISEILLTQDTAKVIAIPTFELKKHLLKKQVNKYDKNILKDISAYSKYIKIYEKPKVLIHGTRFLNRDNTVYLEISEEILKGKVSIDNSFEKIFKKISEFSEKNGLNFVLISKGIDEIRIEDDLVFVLLDKYNIKYNEVSKNKRIFVSYKINNY